ncbi:hypothetical protein BJX99DRAFT_235484 [Aspergillus californicus]
MPRNVVTAFLRTSADRPLQTLSAAARYRVHVSRAFHLSVLKAAVAHPVTAHGLPPNAPPPAPTLGDRVKRQTEGDSDTGDSQPREPKKPIALKQRFWKNVDVQKRQGGDYEVLLDKRPVRTPSKSALTIPPTKPYLAHAIALEWDVLTSAQQALKNHMIPLTSLTARAGDIMQEDAAGITTVRDQILTTAMRYLETDTLLCWMPEQSDHIPEEVDESGKRRETLRESQMRVAKDIIAFLSTKVWPGIKIVPVLDSNSIFPASQPQATKEIIRQWIQGLEGHDLAALERGILASKSLLIAARLVGDWSENYRHLQRPGQPKFGIEEAAEASSLEVRWQTDMWGEVEDTHDVDKEDLKRQLGSVIILVSGETR